jgi:hypothetical protein
VLPVPAILLAFSLPAIPAARRLRPAERVGATEGGQ